MSEKVEQVEGVELDDVRAAHIVKVLRITGKRQREYWLDDKNNERMRYGQLCASSMSEVAADMIEREFRKGDGDGTTR